MLIVGLTGGIASGKSEVSRYFEKLGAPVVDTDLISRELVAPGSAVLNNISDAFGSEILNQDGALNRRALREIVFADPNKRTQLEDTLHPRIRDIVTSRLKKLDYPYAIVVIPLLLETRYPIHTDRVLAVDTAEKLQIKRLMQRDSISMDAAKQIMAAQFGRKERLAAADDIIRNDGSIETLQRQIESLHNAYLNNKQRDRFTSPQ